MDERIQPHKVTKPIQLLAAWLLGLTIIDGSFLTAANFLKQPSWASGLLVGAAVVNIPLFLGGLFLLQTRFRPEMQEDSYYSKFLELERTTRKPEGIAIEVQSLRSTFAESAARTMDVIERLQANVIELTKQVSSIQADVPGHSLALQNVSAIERALENANQGLKEVKRETAWQAYRVALNDLLPNYNQIEASIKAAGIPITDKFGSTSEHPFRPEFYVVSFGEDVELFALQLLLQAIAQTCPEYLNYAPGEISHNSLYIGSYGYRGRPSLKLGQETLSQVFDCSSIEDLMGLIGKSPNLK